MKKKIIFFSFACHHYKVHKHILLCNTVVVIVTVHCCLMSITVLSNVCHNSVRRPSTSIRLVLSVQPLPSVNVRLSPFIPINVLYSSNRMYYVHKYPISYFSNHMYIFFKIIYRFSFLINTYIYILLY